MKKLLKLITLALACILMVGVIVGVSVAAESTADPTGLTVGGKNVHYQTKTLLCVSVKGVTEETEDDYAMLFWDYNPGTPNLETATVDKEIKVLKDSNDNEFYYFESFGVDAKDMSSKIYFAPATLVDGEIDKVGNIYSSSIVDYAITRLTEQNGTAAQNNLYYQLLRYAGTASAKFFENINTALVMAENGYVGKYDANVVAATAGDTVLLRAEAKNADDEYFLYWLGDYNQIFSYERVIGVKAEAGAAKYTAVYGDKADSAYATTYNFEALANGENGILFTATNQAGDNFVVWDSVNAYYYSDNNSKTINGMGLNLRYSKSFAKVTATKPDDEATPLGSITGKDKDGNKIVTDYYVQPGTEITEYTANEQAKYWVVTNAKTGDKAISSNKVVADNGMSTTFTNPSTTALEIFEFDVSFDSYKNSTPIQVQLNNGSWNFANFSININQSGAVEVKTNVEQVKTENAFTYNNVEKIVCDSTARKIGTADFSYEYGSTLTLRFVVDNSKALPEVAVYADGEYVGTAGVYKTANGYTYYDFASAVKGRTYAAANSRIKSGIIFQLRASTATQTVDNVTFLKKD